MFARIGLVLCLIMNVTGGFAQGDIANVTQLHIRLKPQAQHSSNSMLSGSEAASFSSTAGVALTPKAVTPSNAQIVGLPQAMTRAEAWAIATKLSTRPDIENVEPIDQEFNKRPPNKPTSLPH